MKMPSFKGTKDPDLYLDWERRVEAIFDCHNYSEGKKVKLAAVEFSDYAASWWKKLARDRLQEELPPIATWAEMKRVMRKRFIPSYFQRDLQSRLQHLKQGSMSVDEYFKSMNMAMIQDNCMEEEEATIARFLNSLITEIANVVEIQQYVTLDELVDLSVKVEKQIEKKQQNNSWRSRPNTISKKPWSTQEGKAPSKPQDGRGKGKVEEGGKTFNPKSSKPSSSIQYHKCHRRGHMMHECPSRRNIILRENGEYESEKSEGKEEEGEGVSEEDDLELPNDGIIGVVRRIMTINLGSVDEGQRENLFHTRYGIKGKTYSMIIDGGSCANVACHVLLGPPWQYDRDTTHHGRKNSVSSLLQNFEDVFPDDTPKGLPPMRGIEHQIDFVPGSQLPDRPAYMSNPEETKELQRQVEEFLEKGFVRESMSPCSVPILFVPKKDGTWRMCVDCRAINKITVKYRHPTPRLDDMLDQLYGSKIFSKIDLKSGYHQIRMNLGDEWKTAFKTKYGLYEWLVMPFGLTNAPSTFMRLMNHVFKDFHGKFIVVSKGVEVDDEKIKAIKEWSKPNSSQGKLSRRHAKWVEFIETFPFVIAYKQGKENVVADALSKRYVLISTLTSKLLGFDQIKFLYANDSDFGEIFAECKLGPFEKFNPQDEFLFKENKLCFPNCSLREPFVKEAHCGGLMGHFGVPKTLEILSEHFYCPSMRKDVEKV
ncbi:uncharacterized protein LOC125859038 [Solanum stenotomum]|uniref:uncharacterized protein LOC125859038 n=1 Tax=Solanum stenotomum TaxID=172797 RepID=UPI0020D14C20|nr:uncharacterized protein LOC125859038 [Solanum stenotomum]